jgi:hypothetical protein
MYGSTYPCRSRSTRTDVVPSRHDGYIKTEHYTNLLRERGYKFRGERETTKLWSHPQTTHAVNVPMGKTVAIAEVRVVLQQMGLKQHEIETIIGAFCS